MKIAHHHFSIILLVLLLTLQCKPLYFDERYKTIPVDEIPHRSQMSINPSDVLEPNQHWEDLELQSGDNLGKLLIPLVPDTASLNGLMQAISNQVDLRRMQTGQKFHLLFADDILKELQIIKEKEIICFTLEDTGWQSLVKIRELNTLIRFARGDVDSSLYNAAVDANIPLPVLMEMIQLFSFEVDFQRDIYNGDYFQVAYEDILDEHGNSVDTGRVIFAYLFSNGATVKHELYRYKDFQGNWDYYNSLGHTIRRELLKTPVNGAYISSGYGMRVSPFLGYSKMHQGMDFAAPQGTPIYAAGGGTITTAGWSNVYGWYIKIRHVNHYETLYGHMVSFRSGLRRGSRVEQGQIIGYVGSTGMSTGPHCHYEVHYYGEPINPSTVRFPPGKILQGEELELFQLHRESLISSFL